MAESFRNRHAFAAAAGMLAVLGCAPLWAQDGKPPKPPDTTAAPIIKRDDTSKPNVNPVKPDEKNPQADPEAELPNGESVPLRDPTQDSQKMIDAIKSAEPRTVHSAPMAQVAPLPPAPPPIPDVVLKAYIEMEGKPASALLEIDGKLQRLVSEGSALTAHAPGRPVVTLVVKKMSRDGIDIELVQLKTVIHVK